MSVYEYDCMECGVVEVRQSIHDAALKYCPNCGCKVKRLVSLCTGFIFKGKGFHSTDYGKSKATIGTGEKPSKGNVFFDDAFPEQGRIVDKVRKRRASGKKLDGACCKEAGVAYREAESKQFAK